MEYSQTQQHSAEMRLKALHEVLSSTPEAVTTMRLTLKNGDPRFMAQFPKKSGSVTFRDIGLENTNELVALFNEFDSATNSSDFKKNLALLLGERAMHDK